MKSADQIRDDLKALRYEIREHIDRDQSVAEYAIGGILQALEDLAALAAYRLESGRRTPLPHPDPYLMEWHPSGYPSEGNRLKMIREAWDKALAECGTCENCVAEKNRREAARR